MRPLCRGDALFIFICFPGRRGFCRSMLPLIQQVTRFQVHGCWIGLGAHSIVRFPATTPKLFKRFFVNFDSNESPESECSPGRADQLHDGVCSIEQRQHGRHHEQEKSRGLGREVLMRFAREVIPAESMERRINLEYRFHASSSEFRSLVSGL